MTPLRAWEVTLERPFSLQVVPVFAFLNAGIVLSDGSIDSTLTSGVGLGVIAGLLLGKPQGIFLATALSLKHGPGELPSGMKLSDDVGIGLLAGMGFTMLIFIGVLSFKGDPQTLRHARTGIMLATFLAGIQGLSWMWLNSSKNPTETGRA